uniref:Uncharacterized protein n=1 Tax=viral metagenome TaxID=1070528 RepID=A0A6M3M808_9ZZZZ
MAKMLNQYRFCIKEYVRDRKPKCFVIQAPNKPEAWNIAKKRITVKKLKR